jgi:hypothetical protein
MESKRNTSAIRVSTPSRQPFGRPALMLRDKDKGLCRGKLPSPGAKGTTLQPKKPLKNTRLGKYLKRSEWC